MAQFGAVALLVAMNAVLLPPLDESPEAAQAEQAQPEAEPR